MNIKAIAIGGLILLSAGFLIGRYVSPPKEIIKTEIQEKEVIKKDIVTVVKEITKADGTKEVVTTTTDKSIEKKDKQIESLVSKSVEKKWLIGVGVNPIAPSATYSARVDIRVLGPVFIGGQYIRNKSDNVGLVNLTVEL